MDVTKQAFLLLAQLTGYEQLKLVVTTKDLTKIDSNSQF